MYARFQNSYRRMEESLQRLTDSIAAYNPSPTAAEELIAADDAVNEDLERRKCFACHCSATGLTQESLATPIELR